MIPGHALILAVSLATGQWVLPIVLTFGHQCCESWLFLLSNNAQHVGLKDKVSDFRLCCRTLTLNPVFRFRYLQMNSHRSQMGSSVSGARSMPF